MNWKKILVYTVGSMLLLLMTFVFYTLISVVIEEPKTQSPHAGGQNQEANPTSGVLEASIEGPSQQSNVKIVLTVKLAEPAKFPPKGSASLEAESQSGQPCFGTKNSVEYVIEDTMLRAEVDLARPEKKPLTVKCTLRVKDKKGQEASFPMQKSQVISPIEVGMFYGISISRTNILMVLLMSGFVSWWFIQGRHVPEIVRRTPRQADASGNVWEEVLGISVWHRTALEFQWESPEDWLNGNVLQVSYRLDGHDEDHLIARQVWTRMCLHPFGVLLPLKKTAVLRLHCRSMPATGFPSTGHVRYRIWCKSLSKAFEGEIVLTSPHMLRDQPTLPQPPIVPVSPASPSPREAQSRSHVEASLTAVETSLAAIVAWLQKVDRFLALEALPQALSAALTSAPSLIQQPRIQDMASAEAAILATVNHWWEEGHLDRYTLQDLLERIGLPAHFYALKDLASAAAQVETSFSFEESANTGGWLLFQPPGASEALTVPADPTFFATGQVMTLVKRMFEGFDTLPTPMRFFRAYRACRLRAVSGQRGKFLLDRPGYLQLLPGALVPQHISVPRTYTSIMEQHAIRARKPPGQPITHVSLKSFLDIFTQGHQTLEQHLQRADADIKQIPQKLQQANHQTVFETLERDVRHLSKQMSSIADSLQTMMPLVQTLPALSDTVQQLVAKLDVLKSSRTADTSGEEDVKQHAQDPDTETAESSQCDQEMAKQKTDNEERPPSQGTEEKSRNTDGCEGDEHRDDPISDLNKAREGKDDAPTTGDPLSTHSSQDRQPPHSVFASIPRENWQEALEQAYAASGDRQTDTASPRAPQHYVKRLRQLQIAFKTLFLSLLSPPDQWTASIVHLEPPTPDGRFVLHRMSASSQAEGVAFSCSECEVWVEQKVFWAFLWIESSQHATAWVSLPLGSFVKEQFSGHRYLLAEVPSRYTYITAVLSPAALRKSVGAGSAVYEVTAKMQVEYEHANA